MLDRLYSPEQVPRPYTIASLAERWDCSEGHIRNIIKTGRLRSFAVERHWSDVPGGGESMSNTLNYDPSDPDKMKLPPGLTCGDCFHIRRCKAIFGHVETDTYCDWSPSRFIAPQAKEDV